MQARPGQLQHPLALVFVSLLICWGFGWETVGQWLYSNVDGIIVASRDVPSREAPRYSTEYTVRSANGTDRVIWAGATDGSLPRSMPVGTRIRKQRWSLDYERDGIRVGFPYIFYGIVLAFAVGLLVHGLWRSCA